MTTANDFFEENDVRVGEGKDFGSSVAIYYESLSDAFSWYFKTISSLKDSYNLLFEGDWDRKSLAFNFHANITRDITFSILGFHRFFELLIKDILRRIDPFLAVKFLENEAQLIKHLSNKLNPETVKTVEFNEAYTRFKEAIKQYNIDPIENAQFKPAADFSFLAQDDSLNRLSKWRNRIMHNGTTMPNIFQLDYLVTQRIVPLVLKIIEIEKDKFNTSLNGYFPHYSQTFTGIKILEGLYLIKFDFKDFANTKKKEELLEKYFKLAYLKEFGRATYKLSPYLKKNRLYYEVYYDNPQGRFKRFAESERGTPQFHSIKACPCCGFETLVVYRMEHYFSWFTCTTCSFSLKSNIPDPSVYGYSTEHIFAQS